MAAESGEQRAARMRELAEDHALQAEKYRRVAESIEKGNVGEHKVAALLDVLDGAGWVVLHDRHKSQTSRANIDHIVVGPPGICVIDSKNWTSGRLRLDDRGMAMGRYRRDDELHSAKVAADIVGSQAQGVHAGVITAPVLAFASDVGLESERFHQGVMCMQAERLLPWLTQQPQHLTPQQIHQIGSTLDAAFPPRTEPRAPLTVATLDRYRTAARAGVRPRPEPARLRRTTPQAPARNTAPRQASVRRNAPPVRPAPAPRGFVASAVHDATNWLMRATLAVILILLWITVGMPLMTKFLQYELPKIVSHAAATQSAVPSPSPTGGLGSRHAVPARPATRPSR